MIDTNPQGVGIDRRILLGAAGAGAALIGATMVGVPAQAAPRGPAGADNFYKSDQVAAHDVMFPDQYRMQIAGTMFTPKRLPQGTRGAALVVGHPMGAVRQQSANLYATKMAEQGFVALTIDLPFWGGSEGKLRNAVSPDLYAEAFSAAVDFLQTQPTVDANRIGGIGICGSGSFILSAAKIDPRLRAVATASMYDMGAVTRDGLRHGQSVAQRKAIIAAAARQRGAEFAGGKPAYTGGTVQRLAPDTDAIQREFYDFYRTPRGEFTPQGATPQTTTYPTLTSNPKFMNFYPFNDLETISPRPLLFIAGDQAHSREFSEDAYRRAADPKELVWISGAGHVDLYDRVDLIPWTKLTGFFRQNLA